MFFSRIGSYDPYDTLKTHDQDIQEIRCKIDSIEKNQLLLDSKLDDILRAVKVMPAVQVEPPYDWTAHERAEHGQMFDLDHKGGLYKANSNKIKSLIKRLGKS